MSELVCVTSGCKEGGVGIETSGARRIAFCAKSCDLWTGASASTSPRSSRADAAAAVDRARKLREELDEGSPRLAAPTYAPGNGTPFRAPGNGHANGANGFSESDLALL